MFASVNDVVMNGSHVEKNYLSHVQNARVRIGIERNQNNVVGYCLEIPQAKGQGDTKQEAESCIIVKNGVGLWTT